MDVDWIGLYGREGAFWSDGVVVDWCFAHVYWASFVFFQSTSQRLCLAAPQVGGCDVNPACICLSCVSVRRGLLAGRTSLALLLVEKQTDCRRG